MAGEWERGEHARLQNWDLYATARYLVMWRRRSRRGVGGSQGVRHQTELRAGRFRTKDSRLGLRTGVDDESRKI